MKFLQVEIVLTLPAHSEICLLCFPFPPITWSSEMRVVNFALNLMYFEGFNIISALNQPQQRLGRD